MKLLRYLLILTIACSMFSCRKWDLKPAISPLDLKVHVSYDTSRGDFSLPLQNIEIRIQNTWNNKTHETLSGADGSATFANVSAGMYNVVAKMTIDKDEFTRLTGQPAQDDVVLNAALNNIALNSATDANIHLKLQLGRIGDLVIKQIYYAGSDTRKGASFRDQFIEIYNNSNDTIFADSLYVAQVIGNNSTNPDFSKGYYITSGPLRGQYDWSKSIGMPQDINANDDYFYTKSLYRIPGTGRDYPILPGQSIVIAQTAVNHRGPYSNNTGGTIEIEDPSLTVDLSDADFEVYLGSYLASPLVSDVDNPAVPDMIMIDYSGKDWILDALGRDAFAIFKTTDDISGTYPKYPNPTVVAVTANTTMHYQIPVDFIIDAVEIQPNTPASRVAKKLPERYDAGFGFVPAGSYSSQSIIRKTSKTVGNRVVLTDTNNSSNDFDFLPRAEPRAFKQ